jgi:hypothetical protein
MLSTRAFEQIDDDGLQALVGGPEVGSDGDQRRRLDQER